MTKPHPSDGPSETTLEPVDFDPFAEALDAPFALSEAQREIWAVVQMGPEASCAYNQCYVLTLRGAVSVDAMKRAVQLVFDRQESLRTRFDAWGQWQVVLPPEPIALPVMDFSSLAPEVRATQLRTVLAEEVSTPLDLVNGTGARARLIIEASDCIRLVITAHHIVFDGWSSRLFFQELSVFYAATCRETTAELAPATPFRRQLEIEQSPAGLQRAEVDLGYWRARFADGTPSLDLPTDHMRPPITTYGGARADLLLTRVSSADVTRVASRLGATSVGFLLAGFQALLYRFTGQNDLVVGLPVSARVPNEGDTLMGHATNLLPIRARIDGHAPFANLVREARTALLDCHDHQSLTFGSLVRDLNLPRNTSRTPLVAALFNVGARFVPTFLDCQAEVTTVPRCFVNFELEMQVVDTHRELILELAYSTDLFTAETVERWLGHYEELLAAALANPNSPLDQLPLLRNSDREALREWNRTQAEYPREVALAQLVEAQVERTPDAVAVVCGSDSLSFAELNARANQLAHALRAHGAGPDRLTGVCVERSVDMVVALLAVVKAGAAYLPLDPLLPQERLRYMLEDSGASLVVTQDSLRTSLPLFSGSVVSLDDRSWKTNPRDNLAVAVHPDNLAYVIYTSGSTGKPKGVEVPRGALTNLLWSMRDWLGLTTEDRWLAVTTISFDIAGLEIWLPLLVGARLVVASQDDAADGARLREQIDRHGVTFLQATPVTWRLLLDAGWKGKSDLQAVCGGEAMPRDLAAELAPIVRRLWNLYGPTETTIWSAGYLVRDGHEPVLIGRPVANTQCYILDKNRLAVPIGVVGELYIGGDGLARGYLRRPELTAEKFLPDPFSSRPGARMYRTGDLARYRADGNIECLGRTDHQVKIRGFRLELGEIEAVIAQHAAVGQVVVTAREGAPGDKRLVAYLVAENPPPDLVEQLRVVLRAALPEYMVPPHFINLDAFPLTPNGKIDRKALPAPSETNLVGSEETVAPRNQTEESLAAIWSELLSVGTVGIHDNFFELGGHSLLAIKTMSRVRDVFQVNLPLRRLFENPTVAGLAAVVMEAKGTADEVRRIEPRKQSGPCPLSFAQEQFWLLDQMLPAGSPAYNIMNTIDISGAYNASALKSALDELVRRHEILRTSVSLIDGQLMQTVLPASDVPLPEIDLSVLPELERAREWSRLAREEGQKAFDLSQLPLLRATVVHHSGHEHKVLLVIHHIVADEWAMELIQEEVKQLYAAFSRKQPSPLAELPVQYADFACWQREWFQGEKLEQQIAYWKKELEGASPLLALPTDKPRPRAQTFRGATEFFALPKTLLQGLRALALKEQTTLFMLLQAAFAALLHRYSGQADILVGTPISGRTHKETERLVGCFLNTVVLRSQFAAGQTFRALLQQARARALGAFAHAELPFGRLVATVAPDRDSARTPLFQAMFVLHDADGAQGSDGVSRQEMDTGTSKFDLTLYTSATEDGLQGVMEYSTDLFEVDTVRRLFRHFAVLLQAIVRDPDQCISQLPLLTQAERQQFLVEWNRTEAEYPREVPLAQLVEAQVERTPDAVAMLCESESLSFAELNARANQLAAELRAHGAGPDRLVGICVERSVDMVVALLAVVKAGAAYLPLDPLLPQERLSYMLEDSGASLVVTQESLRASLPAFSGNVVSLDDKNWKSNPRDNLAVAVRPDHLAYVIYTSGSTGRPKGVEVPRGALTNFLWSMRNWLGLTSEDRWLAVTTISFDIAGLEVWLPLLVGARLVVASRDDAADGVRLREQIERHGITFMQATPVTWRVLLEAGWKGRSDFQAVCGGEAMPRDLAAELAPIVHRLWNLYGPTETTIWSTGYLVRDGSEPVLIGRPLANTQCYILDENAHPVPIGVVGELYIGGDGLARGYLDRPELTAEKFLPDPFRSQPGARMYRTGDLARYMADGNIECLGRTDHQVKIRGYRIELGEIEAVLMDDPNVRKAAVTVHADALGDTRIVAYVVYQPGETRTGSEMRRRMANRLPDYMLPHIFVELETLPLTASGKVDRRALPPPFAHEAQAAEEHIEPRTETERAIAALWRELLKIEKVSVRDNFFALGGHSLLSAQMVAQLEKRTGHRLNLRSVIFETVEQLAANCGPPAHPTDPT